MFLCDLIVINFPLRLEIVQQRWVPQKCLKETVHQFIGLCICRDSLSIIEKIDSKLVSIQSTVSTRDSEGKCLEGTDHHLYTQGDAGPTINVFKKRICFYEPLCPSVRISVRKTVRKGIRPSVDSIL